MPNESWPVTNHLRAAFCAYAAASLLHYAHNAVFLEAYPNIPRWLDRTQIYLVWIAMTTMGVIGYRLIYSRYRAAGLGVLAFHATLGFDGLSHYALAPISLHTHTMNLTIWLELATAVLLLLAIVRLWRLAPLAGVR